MKKTFSIKKLLKAGWKDYKENFKVIIGAGVIMILVSLVGQFFGATEDSLMSSYGLASVITVIVGLANVALSMGFIKLMLNIIDNKNASVNDLFHGVRSFKHFILFIILSILVGIVTLAGFIVLIIPGIIISLGLMFAKLSFVDRDMGVIETMKYNWKLTKGHRWWLFVFILVTALFNILGAIVLLIGLIITVPVTYLAHVRLYRMLTTGNMGMGSTTEPEIVDIEAEEFPFTE